MQQGGYGGPPQAQPVGYGGPGGAPYGVAPGYGAPGGGYGGQPMMQPGYGAPMMQPGYGAPGMPAGMGYAPGPMIVTDPWAALHSVSGLIVKEGIKLLEFLTGYEQANHYQVFAMNPGMKGPGAMGAYLFNLHENSDCCARQMCGPSRGFTMAVQALGQPQQFCQFERPFKCTFMCCERPEIFVRGLDGVIIGSVYSNFRCCDDVLEIRDAAGTEIFRVNGPCCQPGKCCQCPCPPFDEFIFYLHNAGGVGEPIGDIKRVWPGCGQEMMGDVNTFSTTFPAGADVRHKILILAAVMLVDFLYFEKRNKQDGELLNNGGGF